MKKRVISIMMTMIIAIVAVGCGAKNTGDHDA